MRVDLQPYAERCELTDHVAMTLYEYQGGDTSVVRVGKAVLGTFAKKMRNDRDMLRYLLRNDIEQPFRAVTSQWEVEVPFALRKEFQVLGRWIFDSREGDRYAAVVGKPYSYGIWTVDLWDLLQLMDRWSSHRMPREMRYVARHLVTVTRKWCPITWEAWSDYVLNGVHLSRAEIIALQQVFEEIVYSQRNAHDIDIEQWWRQRLSKNKIYDVEQDEFVDKMGVTLWGSRQRRRHTP
jgi:hypothetical protein